MAQSTPDNKTFFRRMYESYSMTVRFPNNEEFPLAISYMNAYDNTRAHAYIPICVLLPMVKTDTFTIDDPDNYQRQLSSERVASITKGLIQDQIDFPTSILLNHRNLVIDWSKYEASNQKIRVVDESPFYPQRPILDISETQPLWVIDGQHRLAGLKAALDKDYDRFKNYIVSVEIGLGWSREFEREMFHLINSTSKNLPMGLIYSNQFQMAQTNAKFKLEIERSGKQWQLTGEQIAETLAQAGHMWEGLIRFPNQPEGKTTISNNGMGQSLEFLLGDKQFRQLQIENQVALLDAYWSCIRDILPECFLDTKSYALHATKGAWIMHRIARDIFEQIYALYKHPYPLHGQAMDFKDYSQLHIITATMRGYLDCILSDLDGENLMHEAVSGADFWRKGNAGAVTMYSNRSSYVFLHTRLQDKLAPMIARQQKDMDEQLEGS